MKYREYQRALGLARKCGYKIGVNLNATYEKLQSEYIKHFNALTVTFDYVNSEVIIEDEKLSNSTDDAEVEMVDTRETSNKEATNMAKKKINGVVLYEGLSAIDNTTPIVVIATGLTNKTANPKTGNMIQTWILIQDEFPTEAINNGNDSAICGNCPHRKYDGKRSCYVNPMSFSSVYKAYRKGNYPQYNPELHSKYFQGRKIRYGSYGDPVNIPTRILHHLSNYTVGHTGYTHQWQDKRFTRYQQYFQASVDSLMEFLEAKDAGWGTFRVKPVGESTNTDGEVTCMGGVKTNCALCKLCGGTESTGRQNHVSIIAHGSGAKYVS